MAKNASTAGPVSASKRPARKASSRKPKGGSRGESPVSDAPLLALVEEAAFAAMARAYRERWGARLLVADPAGALLRGAPGCAGRVRKGAEDGEGCQAARVFALEEAARWGDPTVSTCPGQRFLWAVPVMLNQVVLGGVLAEVAEAAVFAGEAPLDVRRACADLRLRVEEANWTNAETLRARRQAYYQEQQRAYAIHDRKNRNPRGIRDLYLHEEPALFAAIRSGDRPRARDILNRVLVAIYHHAGSRLALAKSYLLELVVSMSRTAVDAGGDPEELLGAEYGRLTELARIESDEDLAGWLRSHLEQLMEAIERNRKRDPRAMLFDALAYMEAHCGEHLGRDEVARAVHISPSHFSFLIRKESGATFTELLMRMRADRAAELLARSDKPLATIALECGFHDQSHFTKVFKRLRGSTPRAFRTARAS